MSTTEITTETIMANPAPTAAYELAITLCDALNPGHGYQIRLTLGGADVFFGAKDPATGADLLTYADALRVASYYGPPPASTAPLSLATVEPPGSYCAICGYCAICDCERDHHTAGHELGHDWICTACWAERPVEVEPEATATTTIGGGQ